MDNLCPHVGDDHQIQTTDRVGWYRALVVETNDPLNLRRIRIKLPEFHDYDIKPEDAQWAIPAPSSGGKRNGRFENVCIGDSVWISFEKGCIYNPIWHGIATPTRRGLYPIPSVYTETPDMIKHDGTVKSVNDYDKDYLPKDGRPMSSGWTDRYGNFEISSAVGFFPKEHTERPADPGQDTIKEQPFVVKELAEQNNPDAKYFVRGSKYGTFEVIGDQGYKWNEEFKGDVVEDEEFEIKRWKYIQRLLCEDEPKDKDQRRWEVRTRAGHKGEFRDVGWNKTRDGELGDQVTISDSKLDQRWIKFRTKGGILWQMSDVGSDPTEDEFYKRHLIEECGTATEKEDEYFKDKDFRMFRVITRHGFKLALDDRGTHKTAADKEETPRGNGLLIKGRRSPGRATTGNPIGFYWEFNENEDAQRLTFGTPLGAVFQMSDDLEYTLLCQSVPKYPMPWQGIKENEFLLKPVVMESPETESHHFKIDHQNEYIRFKTRAGKGAGPFTRVVKSDTSLLHQQGVEFRDGTNGDGAWAELVDGRNRGIWLSTRYKLGIWRAEAAKSIYIWFDENKDEICIVNRQSTGKIKIYSNSNIDLISGGTINIQAGKDIILKAGNQVKSNKRVVISDSDAVAPPTVPDKIFPADRGETYNKPKEMDIKEVQHPSDAPAAAKNIPSKDTSRATWDRIAGNDT